MANFHKNSKLFIDMLTFDTSNIILEIGSDRAEGSTEWFDELAKTKNVDFYSIDVVDEASKKFKHLTNTNFVVAKSGSIWTHTELSKLKKKIKVLYLDNYDWISSMNNINSHEQRLIDEYAKRGVTMTNLDCQREHLYQMIGCLPYMEDESLIICDDTPYNDSAGVYFGKNGAVVPYLLNFGYEIVFGRGHNRNCEEDNGIILYRKIQ
jgi:hypothetical protein